MRCLLCGLFYLVYSVTFKDKVAWKNPCVEKSIELVHGIKGASRGPTCMTQQPEIFCLKSLVQISRSDLCSRSYIEQYTLTKHALIRVKDLFGRVQYMSFNAESLHLLNDFYGRVH